MKRLLTFLLATLLLIPAFGQSSSDPYWKGYMEMMEKLKIEAAGGKGKYLYREKKYDDVIKYYSEQMNKGVALDASDNCCLGAAMIKKAQEIQLNAMTFTNFCQRYQMDENSRNHFIQLEMNLDLARDYYINGYNVLNEVLSTEPTNTEALSLTRLPIETCLDYIADREKQFLPYWNWFQQENAARRNRIEQQRQQEAMLVSMLVGAVQNILSEAINGGSSQSYTQTYNYSVSPSSSNRNAAQRKNWQNRKTNAEKLLNKHREQQKKNPNASYLKNSIRTQEAIIKSCNEGIAGLK